MTPAEFNEIDEDDGQITVQDILSNRVLLRKRNPDGSLVRDENGEIRSFNEEFRIAYKKL